MINPFGNLLKNLFKRKETTPDSQSFLPDGPETRNVKRKKRMLFLAVMVIIFFFCGFIAFDYVMRSNEKKPAGFVPKPFHTSIASTGPAPVRNQAQVQPPPVSPVQSPVVTGPAPIAAPGAPAAAKSAVSAQPDQYASGRDVFKEFYVKKAESDHHEEKRGSKAAPVMPKEPPPLPSEAHDAPLPVPPVKPQLADIQIVGISCKDNNCIAITPHGVIRNGDAIGQEVITAITGNSVTTDMRTIPYH